MLQRKFRTRFVRDATRKKNVSAFSLVRNGPQKTVNKILNIDLSQWQSEPSVLFYTRAQFLALSLSLSIHSIPCIVICSCHAVQRSSSRSTLSMGFNALQLRCAHRPMAHPFCLRLFFFGCCFLFRSLRLSAT